MKFEDLKLVQKWREYAGPKDERLEAESAKIYKIGFVLLSFGMLMIFFYQFIARQVAWVHSDASEMPHGFATPFEAAMYLWLVLVMLICAGLQTRKGYVDTNRFGQTEHLPVGYFLLVSGLSGAAFALVIAAMRCIAEAQIVPLESVFWLANLATGVFCGATIFAATFAALCATFFHGEKAPRQARGGVRRYRRYLMRKGLALGYQSQPLLCSTNRVSAARKSVES